MKAAETVRGSFAQIDLPALKRNFERIRSHVAPAEVLAIVKADGYGHGSLPVSRALLAAGACGLGVTTVEEGLALRNEGIACRVLVLGGTFEGAYREILARKLTPVVGRSEDIRAFGAAAASLSRKAEAHIKIDTGMSRLGLRPEVLASALDTAKAADVSITGVMTHLAAADAEDLSHARAQLTEFERGLKSIRGAGLSPRTVHTANTAAALRMPEARGNMVRVGLGLYGTVPSPHCPDLGLEAVLSVRSRIIALREISAGDCVGYGARWRADGPSTIATVPVGYGDGYLRRLSGRSEVLVRGRRARCVGSISMDLMMIDVTGMGAEHGDEVVLLGKQAGESVKVEEIADWADTIPYELLCGLARRIPRRYDD